MCQGFLLTVEPPIIAYNVAQINPSSFARGDTPYTMYHSFVEVFFIYFQTRRTDRFTCHEIRTGFPIIYAVSIYVIYAAERRTIEKKSIARANNRYDINVRT